MNYITIIDSLGGELGYGGDVVPISHRILLDKGQVFGSESLRKLFSTHESLMSFLYHVQTIPTGSHHTLSWYPG